MYITLVVAFLVTERQHQKSWWRQRDKILSVILCILTRRKYPESSSRLTPKKGWIEFQLSCFTVSSTLHFSHNFMGPSFAIQSNLYLLRNKSQSGHCASCNNGKYVQDLGLVSFYIGWGNILPSWRFPPVPPPLCIADFFPFPPCIIYLPMIHN